MAEKMTAVWLIILTIIVCASVPAVMILLTSPHPKAQMSYGMGVILFPKWSILGAS
jgi:hypothetical protein